MRILVLGGTQFVGRHVVEKLLQAGHKVTTLNRGQTPDTLPPDVERLRGEREHFAAAFAELRDRSWDGCIDLSGYVPGHVAASTDALRERVAHYVYMSTVSVYPPGSPRPVDERAPVKEAATDDTTEIDEGSYGPMKVRCEQIVRDAFPSHTVLRPQIIAGPHDHTGRYAFWLIRARSKGMLAPGDGTDHVQTVDVRDVADFVVRTFEQRLCGTFNLAGHRVPWSEFVQLLDAKEPAWVAANKLSHLTFRELPLFRAEFAEDAHGMDINCEQALSAGFRQTPLRHTVEAARAWACDVGDTLAVPEAFLSEADARQLIKSSR